MLFERPFKALFYSLNIKNKYIDSKLKHILLLFFYELLKGGIDGISGYGSSKISRRI